MTVTATVLPDSRPRSARSSAKRARRTSPSTMVPLWSTAITRSASPSRARPRSAWCSTTERASCAGSVEPHSSLMLAPSGRSWRAVTGRPTRRTPGAPRRWPRRWRNRARCANRRAAVLRGRDQMLAVEVRGRRVDRQVSHPVPGGSARRRRGRPRAPRARPRPLPRPPPEAWCPSRLNSLMPLSPKGLCEAEIMAPGTPARLGHRGHAGGGQNAQVHHVGTLCRQAGRERGLEQRARTPGVATDHEGRCGKDPCRGAPESQCQFGGQLFVGDPAHPIGAEAA